MLWLPRPLLARLFVLFVVLKQKVAAIARRRAAGFSGDDIRPAALATHPQAGQAPLRSILDNIHTRNILLAKKSYGICVP
jgi:hypothetical protein